MRPVAEAAGLFMGGCERMLLWYRLVTARSFGLSNSGGLMAINQWLSEYKEDMSRSLQAGETVAEIIRAFALAVEQRATSGYSYLDTSLLPYPKDVIKSSFIFALKHTHDDVIKNNFKVCLLCLPDWQDGVEDGVKNPSIGMDLSTATPAQLDRTLQLLREHARWGKVALAEANKIKDELAAQGLW